jgi:hypothetical protein
METIRTETPATITREVRVDEPRQVIIEKKEDSNTGLWVVVGIIALLIFSQGGAAGCSGNTIGGGTRGGGRGGWQGGNSGGSHGGGHGGHGPVVKVRG